MNHDDDPDNRPFVCTKPEGYDRIFSISAVKYKFRRNPGLYPLDRWAWSSLRNCIVCLLKLGFLAQAHCICLTVRGRLEDANGKHSTWWMGLLCYETICHYEAGQKQTATGLYKYILDRPILRPADDFEVLEWYRATRSVHCLVLREAKDSWEGQPVSDYDQAINLERRHVASYLRTIDKVALSNDPSKWSTTALILGSPRSCDDYRLQDPLKTLAVIAAPQDAIKSQPSAPDLRWIRSQLSVSDLRSVRSQPSTTDLGGSFRSLVPLTKLGPDHQRETNGGGIYTGKSKENEPFRLPLSRWGSARGQHAWWPGRSLFGPARKKTEKAKST
jgi:hypothetical protein